MSSQRCAPEASSRSSVPANLTKKLLLAVTFGLLSFSLACGSGSSIPITGNFSNSTLKGTYVYRLSGVDTSVNSSGGLTTEFYTEAGVFTADGGGNITGIDDFNSSVSPYVPGTAFTGNYSIGRDGNGSITVNFSAPATGQINLAITMVSNSQVYITEADAFANFSANASGEADLQSPAAIAAAPSGTFVFKVHDVLPTAYSAVVGQLTSTAGAVTGNLDVLRANALTSPTITTGSFSAPDTNGRGTLSYTDSANVASNLQYYIVDSSHVWLMSTDKNVLGSGFAEAQTASPTLSGNYAFGSSGDTTLNLGGVRTVGAFSASGGSITAGAYDSVQDFGAIPVVNQPYTGTYTLSANGRADVTLTLQGGGGGTIKEVFWLVNGGRAFFLINDPSKVEDGTIDQQSTSSFANSNLSGQYALVMDGQTGAFNYLTRVGTFIPNGNGLLNLNEFVNSFTAGTLPGTLNQPTLPGTYSVTANGRTTASITSLSSNIILYMVSPSQGYIIQADAGVEISGKVTLQVSP